MDEDKRKHLEFIQNVITRMNSNSFLIKGWAVTIVSALLALFASTRQISFLIITILPVLLFWGLDAFYLQMERKFRSLYDMVIPATTAVKLYSMNIGIKAIKDEERNKYWSCLKSNTISPFYGALLVVSIACIFLISEETKDNKNEVKVSIGDTLKVMRIDSSKKAENSNDTGSISKIIPVNTNL